MISTSHSNQARGSSVHMDQCQSKELWSCLGKPQIPPQHHIYYSKDHVTEKKG